VVDSRTVVLSYSTEGDAPLFYHHSSPRRIGREAAVRDGALISLSSISVVATTKQQNHSRTEPSTRLTSAMLDGTCLRARARARPRGSRAFPSEHQTKGENPSAGRRPTRAKCNRPRRTGEERGKGIRNVTRARRRRRRRRRLRRRCAGDDSDYDHDDDHRGHTRDYHKSTRRGPTHD